ncbi:MAG: hypothetical protein ACLQQ4_00170 [Bacteroidia bacterium]
MKFKRLQYPCFFFCLLISANSVIAQSESKEYKDYNIRVDYTVTDGMLNGKYISYYKNRKKKAEGNFKYNNRVGEWSVWDTTGKLCAQRIYSNNLEFHRTIPVVSKYDSAEYLSPPGRNADSCYKYYYLAKRDVGWSKRTWSYLYNGDNPILGNNNRLFNILYKQIKEKHLRVYKFNNSDWDNSFMDSIDFSKTPLDTTEFIVIGFLTKEDWFYDIKYGIMDSRIIGICPIALLKHELAIDSKQIKSMAGNIINKDTIGLFWIYYPQARKYLAKEQVNDANCPSYIKNVDDIFFWKYYNGIIYGQWSGRWFQKGVDSWALRLKNIEIEHNIWMGP